MRDYTCTSSHKICFSLLNEPPNDSNLRSAMCNTLVGVFSSQSCAYSYLWMTGVLMMQFIISPKHHSQGGYKQPVWQLLQPICLSACLAVSPQHNTTQRIQPHMHLLSPMGFGTFCQFHLMVLPLNEGHKFSSSVQRMKSFKVAQTRGEISGFNHVW